MDRTSEAILEAHVQEQRELVDCLIRERQFGWTNALFALQKLEQRLENVKRNNHTGQDHSGTS